MIRNFRNRSVSNVRKTIFFLYVFCIFIHNAGSVIAQSFSQIQKLAEQGNAQAQFVLGNMYENGKVCEKDIDKAIYWYKKSLANGNKRVTPHLALAHHSAKQYSEAYPLFLSVAQSPSEEEIKDGMYGWSSFFVGHYKLNGWSVPKDEEGAIEWYEKAKENGMLAAYMTLGECYLKGIGTTKDPQKTFCLYKEASEKFNFRQEFVIKLAICYLEGYGCAKNYEEVYRLIERIADGSNCSVNNQWKGTAQLTLGIAYYKDSNKANHYSHAFHWLSTIAENKDSFEKDINVALYWLQRCYRFGRGVKKDVEKANEIVRNNPSSDGDVPNLIELLELSNP